MVLMKVNDGLLNPLHIIDIYVLRGGRAKWSWDNSFRLYHPLYNKILSKYPWYVRLFRSKAISSKYYTHKVKMKYDTKYITVFKTNTLSEAEAEAERLIKLWDEKLSQFIIKEL